MTQRPDWPALLDQAAAIVESYDTLRHAAAVVLPARRGAASCRTRRTRTRPLSRYTAEARRAGTFPALMDRGRTIHRYQTFRSPAEARRWLQGIYRRDRTEGQPVSLYLGVEKAGIVEQLQEWFGDLGVPVLALGGYGSQTYVDDVVADVASDATARPCCSTPATTIRAARTSIATSSARTDCWDEVRRVALTAAQVEQYALPPQPGKETDSRARGFVERHGRLVQVELDALPPDILRTLYAEAIAEFWNAAA